jgi:hypothetical protein
MNAPVLAALAILPVLAGCEGSSAKDVAPLKTATYYTQHLQEAREVAADCKLMDELKQRTLPMRDYVEWQISKQGVNCQTALSVSEAAQVREYVLKQARPAAPVSAPKPSSPPAAMPLPSRNDQKVPVAQVWAPS